MLQNNATNQLHTTRYQAKRVRNLLVVFKKKYTKAMMQKAIIGTEDFLITVCLSTEENHPRCSRSFGRPNCIKCIKLCYSYRKLAFAQIAMDNSAHAFQTFRHER